MRQKNIKIAALMLVAVFATTTAVSAQEIVFTGEKCPLTVIYDLEAYENMLAAGESAEAEGTQDEETAEAAVTEEAADAAASEETADAAEGTDASTEAQTPVYEEVEVESIDLLCTIDDTYAAAIYNGSEVYIPLEELADSVSAFDVYSLSAVTEWTDFGNGARGDQAKLAQEKLIDLGVLEGAADGIFGSMSQAAVTAFQTQEGLPVTGVVDVFTWGALMEAADGESTPIESSYPPVYTVEEKYALICKNVVQPEELEKYLDPAYKLSYDVFEGIGEITTKNADFGTWTDESGRAIDRLSMNVRRLIYVSRNEKGIVELYPAFEISSVGSYKPNVKSALLRSGNDVQELKVLSEKAWIEGTDVLETTILVSNSEEQTELFEGEGLVLRLKGALRDYDIEG